MVHNRYDELEAPLRNGTLFIADCDGGVDARYKGNADLVITTNRDIEADLLFELQALERVALDVLAAHGPNPRSVQRMGAAALELASRLAVSLGLLQTTAITLGLPTRVIDAGSGGRRRFRLADVAGIDARLAGGVAPSVAELASEVGPLVGWTPAQKARIVGSARGVGQTRCTEHRTQHCLICLRRTQCNGHHLVDAISIVLSARHGARIGSVELNRALRVAADRSQLGSWGVVRRARAWEAGSGMKVIA